MNSFQYIIDPFTLQKTNVMSRRGKKIIKNYINTYNNYKKRGGRVLFPKEYFGLTTDNYVSKGSPELNLPKLPCGQYGSDLPATKLTDNRCCDQTGGSNNHLKYNKRNTVKNVKCFTDEQVSDANKQLEQIHNKINKISQN